MRVLQFISSMCRCDGNLLSGVFWGAIFGRKKKGKGRRGMIQFSLGYVIEIGYFTGGGSRYFIDTFEVKASGDTQSFKEFCGN